MAAEDYVSRVFFSLDQEDLEDFKGYQEEDVQHNEVVNLMHKTGYQQRTERYAFSIDYVIPANGAEKDFSQYKTGEHTATIIKDGGERVLYSGVRVLTTGGFEVDGEKEAVRKVMFAATGKRSS